MSFIYVASPYSSLDKELVHERYLAVCRYCARALAAGRAVYSPIVHCQAIALEYALPTDAKFWQFYNKEMIDAAEGLEILYLPGWDISEGVQWERDYAISKGKTIVGRPEDHPWLIK
jgi:hypothetical protein